MSAIAVTSTTQRIVVNPASSAVSVINAGPVGPSGLGAGGGGLDAAAVQTYLRGGGLVAGSNMAFDLSDPAALKINNTTAYHGETNYVGVVLDDPTDTATISIDPVFKARVATLEGARSIIQTKDSLSNSGPNNYMNFPGSAGNFISTPNISAYNTAGDNGWFFRIKMPSSAPAGTTCLFSRYGSGVAACQFGIFLEANGQLHVTTSDGAAFHISTTAAATPLAMDGNWIWMRIIRIASTGQCSYYTAPDTGSNLIVPTSWTNFQLNKGTFAGSLLTTSGAPFEISGFNGGTGSMFPGQIGRVLWYPNIAGTGTPLLDANASDYTTGTTWTDPQTHVWTISGTAAVVLVGGALANTTAETVLAESDAFAGIPLSIRDTLFLTVEGMFINTSGSPINFTPKLKIGGVNLFTMPALALPSVAASAYPFAAAVKISNNIANGTTQVARAELMVANAVAGTDVGSSVMSDRLFLLSGNRTDPILTMTSIPNLQLLVAMGTASAGGMARALRTQLILAKA